MLLAPEVSLLPGPLTELGKYNVPMLVCIGTCSFFCISLYVYMHTCVYVCVCIGMYVYVYVRCHEIILRPLISVHQEGLSLAFFLTCNSFPQHWEALTYLSVLA